MDFSGLKVKDGRLINDRPVGKSGLEEAAEIRQAMKRNEKTNMIADGIERAEMREEMNNFLRVNQK
jgi:Fe-S cluster biosynthesis and repair protein YggX